jgi:hypothetical protein
MAELGLCLPLEFRDNALGQRLAQFDAINLGTLTSIDGSAG